VKVAFAGTPDFAATVLRGLIHSQHEVGLVISQPDARRGRGRKLQPTPVTLLAHETGLPLVQPGRISEVADEISNHDVLVVAAYGQILRPDTLHAAPNGALNVHASLLPKYRGAAPIERAIMAGETLTGVSIMRMNEGLDTGPVALQETVPISTTTTGGELRDQLAELGSNLILKALGLLESESLTFEQQDNDLATYAAKLVVEDLWIDWSRGGREVHDLIRALAPDVGARTSHPDAPGPIRILGCRPPDEKSSALRPGEIHAANERFLVGTGDGDLEVTRLQFPGSRPLAASDFLRGRVLDGYFGRDEHTRDSVR
jgi:methionyl-tRNA formyltransferase